MRILSFTVKNYRSITSAYKIPLKNYTVLVGPNNEGKSNLLRALVTALTILSKPLRYRRPNSISYRYETLGNIVDYSWERDFPMHLQDNNPDEGSEITLEFELTKEEKKEFKKRINSKFSSILKLKLILCSSEWKFSVLIKGKGKEQLTKKHELIRSFLGDFIDNQYIPSIRTANLSNEVIEQLLEKELVKLEHDQEYLNLLTEIDKLQRPILSKLSSELTKTVSEFIPDVKSIAVESESRIRRALRRSATLYVDDGTKTEISFKGDGIISLTAISLLKYLVGSRNSNINILLAIEEPESHLHPKAIHQLKDILQDISTNSQVIITTHSPLLVEKQDIHQNILVKSSRAKPANKISDIREAIGVKFSDNLFNAFLILLVEGASDEVILKTFLTNNSSKIKSAFGEGILAFDYLHGIGNITSKASIYKSSVCNIHLFTDYDDISRSVIKKALQNKILTKNEITYSSFADMANSEIEDTINVDIYKDSFEKRFNIKLINKYFRTNNKKWTDRVSDCFHEAGQLFEDETKIEVKTFIATKVFENGIHSFNVHRKVCLESLLQSVEQRLENV